jgi:hypothetical protein
MNFEKPAQLISLLTSLRDEPIKSNYESIYINIAKEVISVEFKHDPINHYDAILHKKLIRLSVLNFIYSTNTDEKLEELNWVIDFLDGAFVLVR